MTNPPLDSGSLHDPEHTSADDGNSHASAEGADALHSGLQHGAHQDAHSHDLAFDETGEFVDAAAPPEHDAGFVVGTPGEDAIHHHLQTTGFTCVPATEIGIVNEFTGARLSEAEATYEAAQHGWLTREGTDVHHVGAIMTLFGVDNHHVANAQVGDLVAELSLGHKVIVGVDASILHDPGHPMHEFAQQADTHAVWLTAFDATDAHHVHVVVNDSADPHGRGATYELQSFLDAWHTTGFEYVATDRAPPHLAEHVHDFDPQTGRFEALASAIQAQHPDFLDGQAASAAQLDHGQHDDGEGVPSRAELLKSL